MVELDIGLWLKPEDIGKEAELEFTDEGELRLIELEDGTKRSVFDIGVKLPNGQKRIWTMNTTSQRLVASKYGTETKDWVGKKVRVKVVQQAIRGELKNVIYAYDA